MRYRLLVLLAFLTTGCIKQQRTDSSDEANFAYGRRNYGSSAQDLLTARNYLSLIVEVQYMEGFKPDETALKNLGRFLQQHLNKPGGIYFTEKQIPAVADTVLSHDEVNDIQQINRTLYSKGSRFALYILYTNGHYKNKHVLGHAFLNSCIVIYGAAIKANAERFSIPTQTTLETTLLKHEMGHLLGLVNKGTEMQEEHSDSAHEAHCQNPGCAMYWSMGVKPEFGPLALKTIPDLDSACLNDLRKIGGR